MSLDSPSTFRAFPLAVALILSFAPAAAAEPTTGDGVLEQRVRDLVAALSSGDPAAYERFAQESFAPQLLAKRSADDRRAFVERFHGDFGSLDDVRATPSGPWGARVEVRGGGPLAGFLELELEDAPPHRISRLGVRVEAGDEEPATQLPPPPALRGVETADALASALDPYLGALAADGTLSGVVLVARDGEPLYQRAFGYADEARKVPNTPATRFNVASIGKQLTQVAVGQLLEQGRLKLEDPVVRHLPDYPNADAAKKMTIGQLVDHRAGVVDIFSVEADRQRAPTSNREWYALVAPKPLDFEPGTARRYCNGCYVVLGEIVAAVSGLSYEDSVRRNVVARAGMTATDFLVGSDPIDGQAIGYTRGPRGLEPASLGKGGRGSGAGGIFSTATDLLAFDEALRRSRLLDAERTAWMLGSDAAVDGRIQVGRGVAGGSPGANAILEGQGPWTVIVLTNRDPRTAEDLGSALARSLGD